jgi:acyl-coenzyme A synthetase/AMP-(fatty) acid ligase
LNITLPLHRHALRQPDKVAAISESQTLSYRELDTLVWNGAAFFRDRGLVPGDRVFVMIAHPMYTLLACLALARLGVAYMSGDPEQGHVTVAGLSERIGARAVICQQSPAGPAATGWACPEIVVDGGSFSGASKADSTLMAAEPDRVWRLMTSSGTTGAQKLFALTHEVGHNRFRQTLQAIPTALSDIFLSLMHPAFILGEHHYLQTLANGGSIVMPVRGPEGLCRLIRDTHVNRLLTVPSLLQPLLSWPESHPVLERLAVLHVTGALVSHAFRERIVREITPRLHVTYGSNEASYLTTVAGTAAISIPDTVGHPVPSGAVQIVDENGALVPPGTVGRIRGRHSGMIAGYLDDPEADRRSFRDGWFYPGDLGCWSADGQVIFKGRADDMMIYNGMNVYPTEIETCLLLHPAVLEAFAFAITHDPHGDVPIAAVRLRGEASEDDLLGFAKERLGARHPRKVFIVDDFPRTATGKPIKRAMILQLREILSADRVKAIV